MEDTTKNVNAEELAAEQAALQVGKQEEIQAKIIEEFGFDPDTDAERIEKLVNKELEHQKKLSSAIGQKINYRTKLEEASKAPPTKVETKAVPSEEVSKIVAEQLEKRDLDSLEYSDDLKKEIQRISKMTGKSIKETARDPYIANKIQDWEKEQRSEAASISRTNRSNGKKTYSFDNPPEVDMATPEGRKKWDDYLDEMKKAGH